MNRKPFYLVYAILVMVFIMGFSTSSAAPSRFDVMKSLKWRVINSLEENLHAGLLDGEQKELIEYTIYKIKSSIGQFTNREFFEDVYYQTHQLVKIKTFISSSEQRANIDNLIQFYQTILKEMYSE